MSTEVRLITAEEYAEMVIDQPTELVRGEIVDMVRPGGRHGLVCINIGIELGVWAKKSKAGQVIGNDSGVLTERNPDTVRGPDLYFITQEKLPDGRVPIGWTKQPPELCIEVLSPHDRWGEVVEKIAEYFAAGVLEVWIADPEEQILYLYDANKPPQQLSGDQLITSEHLPGFESHASAFFDGC